MLSAYPETRPNFYMIESLRVQSQRLAAFAVIQAEAGIQRNGLDSPVSSTGQAQSSTE
jgi:hypothetical protein